MQKVLTSEEMGEVDRLTTEEYGIPSILLMENAAHAAFRVIEKMLGGSVEGKSFLILCGKGNNGGDGAALARILWTQGAIVEAYLFGNIDATKGDAKTNFCALKNISNTESQNDKKLYFESIWSDKWNHTTGSELQKFDVMVDAIFGTGLTRPLGRDFDTTLEMLAQENDAIYISLDVPSGLDSDDAEVIGKNVVADHTITFTAPKLANVLPPAAKFNGNVYVANIGSPNELINKCRSQIFVAEQQDAKKWIKDTVFIEDSYKKRRGNAFLIVGSRNFSGAAVLAGNAAIRTGIGLVTIITSESALESVSSRVLAEVVTHGVSETKSGSVSFEAFESIQDLSKKADVLAIGSGLGSEDDSTRELVSEIVLRRKTPVVIDADGLNSLSPFNIRGSDELSLVLTPHEGEFLRLLGTTEKEVLKDRIKAVRNFAEKHKVILVLKGERTLIAAPDGKVVVNPTGNSGLGKAGNGDNLTGIIAGFLAQSVQSKTDIFESVVAAVYVAGLAGDIAAEKFGKRVMLAGDVRDCLTEAFKEVGE